MTNLTQALSKKTEEPKNPLAETLPLSEESSLEYVEGVLNIVFFSSDGIGFPIAEKLLQEGNNVVTVLVHDLTDIGQDKEDDETYRRRTSLYTGILDIQHHKKTLKKMEKIENKDDWIIWFDFNALAPIAEQCLAMGFSKGLFPTMEDLKLEKDRDMAKDIVKKYYKDLSVAEVHDFSQAKEGIDFLNETEGIWVLKGNGDAAKTIVPWNDDPALAKQILIDALEAHSKDYEDGGFILEEKIIGGYEVTPQIVFLDGFPVFTDIDIENKNLGAGNLSVQTGAMQTLVFKTELKDKINKIAFPKWIYDQAKKHKGIFVFDAGLICKDDKYYFTEFCSQRFGYDSFFVELDMAGTVTNFFTKLFDGENPLKEDFGIGTRGMNLHKDGKERRVLEGVSIVTEDPDHTWLFEVKDEDGKLVCTGCGWDLVVFTGSGEDVNKATKNAYKSASKFAFEDLYLRPEFDLLSFDYQTSIPNRYSYLNHKMFEGADVENHDEYQNRERMSRIERRLDEALKEDAK